MKQYGIYARVSDDKKKDDGSRRQDVERQINMLLEYYERKGISRDQVEIYCDDAKSAFTEDLNQRPDFKRLLLNVKQHYLKEFLIEDLTRFSRNLSMGLRWLKQISDHDCNMISLKEGEIEVTSSRGWMQSAMLLMFAEWDSRVKSEKVKSGMQRKKLQGKHIGRPKGRS